MTGPLAGIKILELAGLGPAPLACTLLTDLGAHVLRIERPGAPDGGMDGLATGRARLDVDLTQAAGTAQVLDLVARADVLLEGFRPGVAERLGLGPSTCHEINPRLVYARMTGWGQSGPRASRAGHDINYLSLTGALHAIGTADSGPVPPLNLVADFGGGTMFVVVGILAGLLERERTGLGTVVDAAMVDGAGYLMTMFHRMLAAGAWTDERSANLLDGGAPFYRTYRCKDDGYVAVGAIEPQFYAALLDGLGLTPEDLPAQQDRSGWPELTERFAKAFALQPRDFWTDTFAGTDACVTPVLSLAEASSDPHLTARQAFTRTSAGNTEPSPAPRFGAVPLARDPGGAAGTRAAFGLPTAD